jgi:uncharacterized protein (DUF427 family)
MRAIWNGQVIAESDLTVVVEGSHSAGPTLARAGSTPTPSAAASIQGHVAFWKGVTVTE